MIGDQHVDPVRLYLCEHGLGDLMTDGDRLDRCVRIAHLHTHRVPSGRFVEGRRLCQSGEELAYRHARRMVTGAAQRRIQASAPTAPAGPGITPIDRAGARLPRTAAIPPLTSVFTVTAATTARALATGSSPDRAT